ncbi:amino acid/amide ABC transporter membrane protein 2, HAAT family [Rhizobiales bacterium GAS191]|nr:amino acid/amide ABC transporter membrane protein 2, HAAT family [Rhizobiales bacterium GAS188]SEE94917.1 amino acid/amide ABC transporter membrane protein 2, HAAT family [Rhizobiales bacterium GAS191]
MTVQGSGPSAFLLPLAIATGAGIALLALAPFVSDYVLHVLITSLYYTILAASWNLLAGFTGQFSLAQQAFAAIGAYTSGLITTIYGVPPVIGIICGVVLSAALGFCLGRLVLRMRAIYLAIATWAFAETVHILLTAAYSITRGELGLTVPPLAEGLTPRGYYVTFVLVTLICVLAMYAMLRSRFGIFMRAIRDDELRAESLGIDATRIKTFVFTASSAFAGLAGALYAHYVVVLSPQIADFSEMAKLVIMTVVGGLGSFAGPLIGAAPIQILNSYLAKYGEWDMVIYAVLVIALMRANMGGLAALIGKIGKLKVATPSPTP